MWVQVITEEQALDLAGKLKMKSAMIHMGEKIAFGSECELMDAAADMLQNLAVQIHKSRDALTLIERLYYVEGKAADWRASRMNSVARSAQDGEDLGRYKRIFPRSGDGHK